MRFPYRVKFRKAEATILGRSSSYGRYRLVWRSAGRRRFRSFRVFADALKEAQRVVRDICGGSEPGALTGRELADVRAAKEALADLSKRVSLSEACAAYVQAVGLLPPDFGLLGAVRGFLRTTVNVKRVPVDTAVDEYLSERQRKAVSKDGKRPELAPHYIEQERRRLGAIKEAFKCDVLDIAPDHVDLLFTAQFSELAPKTRNHFRGSIRGWLRWCEGRNYRPEGDKLRSCAALKDERADTGENIEIIGPEQLKALLDAAEPEMQPAIALAAFAAVRSEEILRLDWSDVWKRPGYVEIVARKAKTRARRLIPICDALARWLEPWRQHREGPVVPVKTNSFHLKLDAAFEKAKVPRSKNVLRHSAISHWLAKTNDENKVAQQSGTSPTMLFKHYRQLATEQEAKEWFSVVPSGTPANILSLPAAAQGGAQ